MNLNFFGIGKTRNSASVRSAGAVVAAHRFRPSVEGLEERTVMSHSPMAAPALMAPALMGPAPSAALVQQAARQVNRSIPINIPATVTGITFEAGQLLATVNIAGQNLELPLDLTIDFADGECPILNLEIPDGLHLDLLGLKVDTSGICLDIHAEPGPG